MSPLQSIKFQTADFQIFCCARIVAIFWTTSTAREVCSLVVMGNDKQIMPVLQCLKRGIAFVSSMLYFHHNSCYVRVALALFALFYCDCDSSLVVYWWISILSKTGWAGLNTSASQDMALMYVLLYDWHIEQDHTFSLYRTIRYMEQFNSWDMTHGKWLTTYKIRE